MNTRKFIILLICLSSLHACNYHSRKEVVKCVVEEFSEQAVLTPFVKDSILVGIKWYWGDGWFHYEEGEERFILKVENHSNNKVTFDSVYSVGAWRNKDSCYTLLYRDTMAISINVDGYSERYDTISPQVKNVYLSSSDFSEYILSIRVWSEATDSVIMAYHITEPEVWVNGGGKMYHPDFDILHKDGAIAYINIPMLIDAGVDFTELMNRKYVCTKERPPKTPFN